MSTRGTVLVVDDEAYVRESLAAVLAHQGFEVRAAASTAEALEGERLTGADALVTDLKMPGAGGLALLRRLARDEPGLPVIVLTGHGTVPSAVECMRAGAFDYLLKPTPPEELALVLDRAIRQAQARRELAYLRSGVGSMSSRREPLGVSAGWREVVRLAGLAAPTDTSVLLLGESGTGKEEVARLIHRRSARAEAALVSVNCAAIPTELFESEFFGHRRGAFTGAADDRDGRFRIAHGGTLFMDEINALPAIAQAKVLRVLQDGVFERVGDSRPTRVDVRLICASNTDLEAEVAAGRFRADLFYRIAVLTLHLPPLRERREDVAVLARAFLGELAARLGKAVHDIHPAALAALEAYPWPGNVRELRNVLERGILLEPTAVLQPASLPLTPPRAGAAGGPGVSGDQGDVAGGDLDLKRAVARAERRALEAALERAGGVRREAARLLGVDERNLAYHLRKHGLMDRRRGR